MLSDQQARDLAMPHLTFHAERFKAAAGHPVSLTRDPHDLSVTIACADPAAVAAQFGTHTDRPASWVETTVLEIGGQLA